MESERLKFSGYQPIYVCAMTAGTRRFDTGHVPVASHTVAMTANFHNRVHVTSKLRLVGLVGSGAVAGRVLPLASIHFLIPPVRWSDVVLKTCLQIFATSVYFQHMDDLSIWMVHTTRMDDSCLLSLHTHK